MITVDLEAEVAIAWDGPRYKWECPFCGRDRLVYRESSPDMALGTAVGHLMSSHHVDPHEIRVGFEYWTLLVVGDIHFKKVEKISG